MEKQVKKINEKIVEKMEQIEGNVKKWENR